MKTIIARILIPVAVFVACYLTIGQLQTERQHIATLKAVIQGAYGTLTEAGRACESVATATSDPDVKFLADYMATAFSALDNYGYKTMAEIRSTTGAGAIIKGLETSLSRPLSALKGVGKTVYLLWNQPKAERAEAVVMRGYAESAALAVGVSLVAAITAFCLMIWHGRGYRQSVPAFQLQPA